VPREGNGEGRAQRGGEDGEPLRIARPGVGGHRTRGARAAGALARCLRLRLAATALLKVFSAR